MEAVGRRLEVMPVHMLSEGAGPGAQVPAHLTRIPIPRITIGTDCCNKTVKFESPQYPAVARATGGNDKVRKGPGVKAATTLLYV
ncbi:hypothetical protein INR49_004595 [Caranx melampygus]|nr:hypothetical protein INR49_004595 [Caranx melampygus]